MPKCAAGPAADYLLLYRFDFGRRCVPVKLTVGSLFMSGVGLRFPIWM